MAHELMVPSGFKQCLVRQYERYLGGRQLLSTQNGAADESGWDSEIFDTMLPGRPRVVSNPKNKVEPTWRELNTFVCRDAVDTVTGEEMAPHYEYKGSGERVRIIRYNTMEGEQTVLLPLSTLLTRSSRSDSEAVPLDVGPCRMSVLRPSLYYRSRVHRASQSLA